MTEVGIMQTQATKQQIPAIVDNHQKLGKTWNGSFLGGANLTETLISGFLASKTKTVRNKFLLYCHATCGNLHLP